MNNTTNADMVFLQKLMSKKKYTHIYSSLEVGSKKTLSEMYVVAEILFAICDERRLILHDRFPPKKANISVDWWYKICAGMFGIWTFAKNNEYSFFFCQTAFQFSLRDWRNYNPSALFFLYFFFFSPLSIKVIYRTLYAARNLWRMQLKSFRSDRWRCLSFVDIWIRWQPKP